MAKKTVTIYDVAREAGVSMATVSRVVNGNPNVKPSTRKKVSDVIDRLNYRPNAVARGLASKKTTTVGVIIPDVTNLYFSSLARGIDDIASMYNYNIILTNSDGDTEKEIKVLNTVLAQQVDGVIFMGHELSDEVRKEIDLTDTPVVLAGTIDEQNELPNVVINYEEATADTTQLLADHGNEKIALLGLDIDATKQKRSTKGYKTALENANLSFDESLVLRVTPDRNFLQEFDLASFVLDSGATSAVVEDDRLAIILLNQLIERGVNVPEDFEIVSANNSPLIDISRPKITTVTQPLYDLGAVAMRLLTKLMNDEETDELQMVLPYDIEENGTTK
jgi:LacI family transcriptional regulator